jgi:hypothetical protein
MTEKNTKLDAWGFPITGYPEPTVPEPDFEEFCRSVLLFDENSEATDGCTVEPDGTCPHGHPSWLLYWGMI